MKRVLSLLIAVLTLAFATVPAMAATDDNPSPTASKEYNVTINNTQGGSGTYTSVINADGKYVTLVAHPKNGYVFSHWTILGDYEIVSGSLETETLTVLQKGDFSATPHFKKLGTSSTSNGSTISVSHNSSATSPKTGDNSVYFIFGLLAVLVIASASVGVKLAYSNKK